ncbi:MAG TPA: hypothetical protein VE994_08450 [Terriglobales bacterium]|nr:hypothetical protein [Terriglobales bacterium]
MKKVMLLLLFVVAATSLSLAIPQTTNLTTDILGAHLVYGRGCIACHAPHSGSAGNGFAYGKDAYSGNMALWGQDLTPLYGKTVAFGDNGTYTVTLPTAPITSAHDPATVVLFCLSCHDGNLAKPAMMKGWTVETLPVFGGNAPTFLGNDGTGAGNYNNDHPVGPLAIVGCGGKYDWDCTVSPTGKILMTGTASAQFANVNYGFAVSTSAINNQPTVTCTSCHDQHSQNIVAGNFGGVQGYYYTQFFLRGYYNPNTGGNSAAQFCRQCHGGEANEMHGQMNVPTT